MDKFPISPDRDGYSFRYAAEIALGNESNVVGRYNRGVWNAAVLIPVRWSGLNAEEYELVCSKFQTHIDEGGEPFLIDLILDKADIREYRARFIPDSWSLDSVSQDAYSVSAKLEVEPRRLELASETWPADILIT